MSAKEPWNPILGNTDSQGSVAVASQVKALVNTVISFVIGPVAGAAQLPSDSVIGPCPASWVTAKRVEAVEEVRVTQAVRVTAVEFGAAVTVMVCPALPEVGDTVSHA
jgi:hypothetical protein